MIDINKYKLTSTGLSTNQGKLIPGATTYWGFITGNISDQKDLVDYIETHGGGAAAVWGSISGNISNQTDLMNLLSSFATELWVSSQGYLTSASTIPASQVTCNICGDTFDFENVDDGLVALVSRVEDIQTSMGSFVSESWVEDNAVMYDKVIPIGDPENDEYVDVLKRETEDLSGESEEVELTKQLVLGYRKDGDIYDTIVVNNGFDDKLQLGYQEMFVESDSELGTSFLVKGEFRPFYAPELDHYPVESIDNELTLTEDGGYEIRYIPIDIDNPYSESPYDKLVIGVNTAEYAWDGLTIRKTDDENNPVEVGLQNFSVEIDAETGNPRVVEGDFYAFATKDYVDGLVGTAIDITNNILDQE